MLNSLKPASNLGFFHIRCALSMIAGDPVRIYLKTFRCLYAHRYFAGRAALRRICPSLLLRCPLKSVRGVAQIC